MNTYTIKFKVRGDWIAADFEETAEIEASNLRELAEQTWDVFKRALFHIYKPMESAIFMELRPNPLFSLECKCNNESVEEEDVLQEFFKLRVERTVPRFVLPKAPMV